MCTNNEESKLKRLNLWIDLCKWFISGVVIIAGFCLIRPREQDRLDDKLSLEIAKVYIEGMTTQEVDLWQRRLDLFESLSNENHSEIQSFITSEQDRIDSIKQERQVKSDSELLKESIESLIATRRDNTLSEDELQKYQQIKAEASNRVISSEDKLEQLGVVGPSQNYPYAFAIVGSSPNLAEAQSFAKRIFEGTKYKPSIYKLKDNLYVTQLGKDLSLIEAREIVSSPEVKSIAPDAFVFQSYSQRSGQNLFRRP